MPVKDADPAAADLDKLLGEAMDGTSRPRVDATAPPPVDHEAPHGRDADGKPLAPYGYTKDGKPKRTKAGRPRNDDADRARTAEPGDQADDKPGDGKAAGGNYLADLSNFADVVWFGASALGALGGSLPIVGKLLPEEKIAAQALVIAETKPRLVAAVNLAAQHNVRAEKFCQSLKGGDGFWALQCMFMTLPVLSLSAAVWKGDKALAELDETGETTLKSMAARNKDKMDEFMARIAAQLQAAEEQAMAVPGEVVPESA